MVTRSRSAWVVFQVALVVLTIAGLVLFFYYAVPTVPPRSMTATRMWVVKRPIVQYAREHGALPHDLALVPEMPGYGNSLRDGWGNAILYAVGDDGLVTLTSLGSDGRAGGTGDAADLVGRFSPRSASGAWADDLDEWAVHPVTRPTRRADDQRVVP